MTQKIRNAQTLLASVGYYKGRIDGIDGPQTQAAAEIVRRNANLNWNGWSAQRRTIGAAQRILEVGGHEPGKVDGYWGHNTGNAFEAWQATQRGQTYARPTDKPTPSPASSTRWPHERDMTSFFGAAGDSNGRNTAGLVTFPIPFRIDWNTSQRTTRFFCHELVAPAFQAVFDEAVKHYGEKRYRELNLDRFAGCYNPRRKRGGSTWSTHAWGVAVDLYAEPNGLRMKRPQALFSRAEYEPFWKIVESHGLVSLGRQSDFDWMHFQAARTR